MTEKYQIAVIPGDGIGVEVMPEGLRVLEAVASKFSIDIQFNHHDFPYITKHQIHKICSTTIRHGFNNFDVTCVFSVCLCFWLC